MSLLIKTEKDLHLLQKQKLDEKLNRLIQTISLSFEKKIDGPNGKIQFSNLPAQTEAVKVNFGKIKDHLLSKIREARDTSFYNSLEGYFKEYFNLIKFSDENKRMKQQDFEQFMERINELNTQLGIVYEKVYPIEYKGYRLLMVDRRNLNGPEGEQAGSGSLTGTLIKDPCGDNCEFTGQLEEIERNHTFSGINKHLQIKYIGGREYYFSPEYGAVYLQGNVDEAGTEKGNRLRKERAEQSARLSQGNYEDGDESVAGSYDDSHDGSDIADIDSLRTYGEQLPKEADLRSPTPSLTLARDQVRGLAPSPSSEPEPISRINDSELASEQADTPAKLRDTPKTPTPGLPAPQATHHSPSSPLSPSAKPADANLIDFDEELTTAAKPAAAKSDAKQPPTSTGWQYDSGFLPTGGRRKKHKKSKKYYKKTRARKRKKTKKR